LLAEFIGEGCPHADLRAYVISVHGLRSALANIGNTELSAAASELEQMGRDENIALIKSKTPAFIDALNAYVEKLTSESKEEEEKGEAKEEEAADFEFLRGKLQAVKAACDEFDKNTAEDVIRELRKISWQQPAKDLLLKISTHLLHGEFEEAAVAADTILKSEIKL
jgi:hypothetical protein